MVVLWVVCRQERGACLSGLGYDPARVGVVMLCLACACLVLSIVACNGSCVVVNPHHTH